MRFLTLLSSLCLLTSILLSKFLCNGTNQHFSCSETEKNALLKFKQDLEDHSNRLSSWEDEEDCCKCNGVVCDNLTGHVHEIHLRGFDSIGYRRIPTAADLEEILRFKLGGKINPSLLNLKHLKYLDLSNNNFKGIQFPSFIGSLSSLTYLNPSQSGFEGTVPPQLGNLSMIRYLSLGGFSEDKTVSVENLKWFSNLSLLHHLDMSGVNLSKASDWLEVIHTLPSLVELRLSNCQLSYIPLHTNVSFTSLSVLDLSFNSFNSPIPPWITNLSSLVFLDISACDFYSLIPNVFGNMTSLRKLDVSHNPNLSPFEFKGLFGLTNLISLRVGYNHFQGPIPSGLRNMSSLRDLYMPGNYFNSSIPNWLYSFNRLESLDLHSNNLHGRISSAIGNMKSLVSLNLSSNQLTGKLPNSFGNLCNLRQIDLSINNFTTRVSEFLKSFRGCCSDRVELQYFDMNRLTGHLPNQLCHFNNLAYFSLQSNSIFGPIPACIGRLSSLKSFDISNNQINGTLPKSLGQLVNLEELVIHNNSLRGVVSESPFSNLTRLRVLTAHDNALTIRPQVAWIPPFQLEYTILSSCQLGPKFPPWLRSQRKLYALDIANTGILDTIPTWFWSIFSHLTYLNLSHNQIQGKLPSVLNYSCRHPNCDKIDPLFLVAIDLSSNHFDGPLPLVSSDLNLFDLSNNSFLGSLHHFLCDKVEKEKRLEVLNLGNNLLSGEIPDCWMNWQSLSTVKLANNNLVGSIPSSMRHLSSLKSLNLRRNKLSGKLPMVLMKWTELVIIDLAENEFIGSIPTWIGSLTNLKVLNLRWNKFTRDIPHELCCLTSIQILDLAHNNLSGTVPRCFNNFSIMAAKDFSNDTFIGFSVIYPRGKILDSALLVVNGREFEYNTILKFVTILDLSSNNLSGGIPDELMSLVGLIYLSLSRNHLTGRIPGKIGDMKRLESLDLSVNRFSGEIPLTMGSMTFLSRLNLSYNNLKGKIPSSTQIQSFDGSSFVGNGLCGPPLTKSCEENEVRPNDENRGEEGDDDRKVDWFSVTGMVVGFVVSFWAVMGPLILSVRWRIAYFQFIDDMRYKFRNVIDKYCCSMFNS